jgi:hypothetical protein
VSKKPAHLTSQAIPSKPQQAPRENPNVVIDAYKAAFGKHYPHHSLDVKRGKARDGAPVFHVVIGGDKGDRPLTLADLKEAAQAFLH